MKTNLLHGFFNSKSDASPLEASTQEQLEQDFQEYFEQKMKDYDFAQEFELNIVATNWWRSLPV